MWKITKNILSKMGDNSADMKWEQSHSNSRFFTGQILWFYIISFPIFKFLAINVIKSHV